LSASILELILLASWQDQIHFINRYFKREISAASNEKKEIAMIRIILSYIIIVFKYRPEVVFMASFFNQPINQ